MKYNMKNIVNYRTLKKSSEIFHTLYRTFKSMEEKLYFRMGYLQFFFALHVIFSLHNRSKIGNAIFTVCVN